MNIGGDIYVWDFTFSLLLCFFKTIVKALLQKVNGTRRPLMYKPVTDWRRTVDSP